MNKDTMKMVNMKFSLVLSHFLEVVLGLLLITQCLQHAIRCIIELDKTKILHCAWF